MTISDRVMAVVKGMTSESERLQARARAQAEAGANDWLASVVEQHLRQSASA